jgi:hypothetical protein
MLTLSKFILDTCVFEGYYTDYNWGLGTVGISPDNYYRVKSYYRAEDRSIYDQTTAVTEAIYVD